MIFTLQRDWIEKRDRCKVYRFNGQATEMMRFSKYAQVGFVKAQEKSMWVSSKPLVHAPLAVLTVRNLNFSNTSIKSIAIHSISFQFYTPWTRQKVDPSCVIFNVRFVYIQQRLYRIWSLWIGSESVCGAPNSTAAHWWTSRFSPRWCCSVVHF